MNDAEEKAYLRGKEMAALSMLTRLSQDLLHLADLVRRLGRALERRGK